MMAAWRGYLCRSEPSWPAHALQTRTLTWLALAFTSPQPKSSSTTCMSFSASTAARAASIMGVYPALFWWSTLHTSAKTRVSLGRCHLLTASGVSVNYRDGVRKSPVKWSQVVKVPEGNGRGVFIPNQRKYFFLLHEKWEQGFTAPLLCDWWLNHNSLEVRGGGAVLSNSCFEE